MQSRHLTAEHLSYSEKGKTSALSAPSGKQLIVYLAKVLNRSGAALNAAIGRRLDNGSWKVFQLDDSADPDAVDVTTAIQAGTSTSFFADTNDGILIQADRKFNLAGLTVGQAETGSPVYTYQYFNGTSYQTLTTIETYSFTSTGDKYATFLAPVDWAVGTTAAVGGDTDMFSLKVTATTAPSQTVDLTDMWIGQFIDFRDSLQDNQSMEISFSESKPLVFESGEGLLPYFSTANAGNAVTVWYNIQE